MTTTRTRIKLVVEEEATGRTYLLADCRTAWDTPSGAWLAWNDSGEAKADSRPVAAMLLFAATLGESLSGQVILKSPAPGPAEAFAPVVIGPVPFLIASEGEDRCGVEVHGKRCVLVPHPAGTAHTMTYSAENMPPSSPPAPPPHCEVPPPGWWCSRTAGHDGPCAARPDGLSTEAPPITADRFAPTTDSFGVAQRAYARGKIAALPSGIKPCTCSDRGDHCRGAAGLGPRWYCERSGDRGSEPEAFLGPGPRDAGVTKQADDVAGRDAGVTPRDTVITLNVDTEVVRSLDPAEFSASLATAVSREFKRLELRRRANPEPVNLSPSTDPDPEPSQPEPPRTLRVILLAKWRGVRDVRLVVGTGTASTAHQYAAGVLAVDVRLYDSLGNLGWFPETLEIDEIKQRVLCALAVHVAARGCWPTGRPVDSDRGEHLNVVEIDLGPVTP